MSNLRIALTDAINKHSAENGSNTPDHILGEYLLSCLAAFDVAVNCREKWHGRSPLPAGGEDLQPHDLPRLESERHAKVERKKFRNRPRKG